MEPKASKDGDERSRGIAREIGVRTISATAARLLCDLVSRVIGH